MLGHLTNEARLDRWCFMGMAEQHHAIRLAEARFHVPEEFGEKGVAQIIKAYRYSAAIASPQPRRMPVIDVTQLLRSLLYTLPCRLGNSQIITQG